MEQFNFRIIKTANGAEVIDSTLSTPYSSLTPMQMLDYINVENSLYFAEKRKRRIKKETIFVCSFIIIFIIQLTQCKIQ